MKLKQFIPQEFCLKCQGCCRFSQAESIWQPALVERLIPYKDHFICPHFLPQKNRCSIYDKRPLDCQLYPFLLHRQNGKITLAIDKKCPYVNTQIHTDKNNGLTQIDEHIQYIINFLSQPQIKNIIRQNPKLINDYHEDVLIVADLEGLSLEIDLNRLSIEDKSLFERYLNLKTHNLSTYNFANIFIWSGHFEIFYKIIEDNLCVFFKDKIGMFLYLSPLGDNLSSPVIKEVFRIMDDYNVNKEVSRIENIEETDLDFYKSLSLNCRPKDPEYVYDTKDITNLSGNRYKSQRASYNFFIKNYKFKYLSYSPDLKEDCISLLENWIKMRKSENESSLYKACLDDSYLCQREALDNYSALDLIGRVVIVDNKVVGFTFGYKLNNNTFSILFEVCDLRIKGLSQFIFSKMAEEFCEFKFINCLDDSGFGNLKRHKLSYHPVKLVPAYIAQYAC